ncbi:MAG: PspA/IM30 family protein [Deltaproteobacteria bacterium]
MGFFSRLTNLIRGTFANWVNRSERRNPEAVYESAIRGKIEQYQKLRQAAAGVLYMRGKLATEVEIKTQTLKSLKRQLDVAVEKDEDGVALALIAQRQRFSTDLDRLRGELEDLTLEAEDAKKNLVTFQAEVQRLRDEKMRVMAKLANAKARLQLQETMKGLVPDADIQALEEVRAHIERLTAEVGISKEVADGELDQKMREIREAEADASARAQLDELKRMKQRQHVPLDLGIASVEAAAPAAS